MKEFAISVSDLGKRYSKSSGFSIFPFNSRKKSDEFWALKDLNFVIPVGESVGIIGHNGAGKSTLLKILGRIISPTRGEVRLRGRVNSLLEVGTGFQPDLSGRANIYLNASILGLSRDEVEKRFDEIVAFSGVGDFIDMPVKHYSSGMYSRLAFAVAAHITGDILLVDEVLSVGDAEFRRKSLSKMNELMEAEHRTVLFVSHSMDAVLRICDRVIWMEKGTLKAFGPADDIVREYLNYSNSLVAINNQLPAENKKILKAEEDVTSRTNYSSVSVTNDNPQSEPILPSTLVVADGIGDSDTGSAVIQRIALYDLSGNPGFAFFRDETIRIDTQFQVLIPEKLSGFIAVRCAPRKGVYEETLVFSDYGPSESYSVGKYGLSVIIPNKLLASGTYYLTVALMGIGKPLVKHHILKRILSFRVADREDENEVVGECVRGVVRPTLIWTNS